MNKKRIISAVLAGLMALTSAGSLVSCSKRKSEPVKEKRTNVYSEKDVFDIPAGVSYVNNSFCDGKTIYISYNKEYTVTYNDMGEEVDRKEGYDWSDSAVATYADVAVDSADGGEEAAALPEGWWTSYDSAQMIASKPIDGGEWTEISIQDDIGSGYISAIGAGNSKLYVAISTWTYNEDYTESTCTNNIITYNSASGERLGELSLDAALVKAGIGTDNAYMNSLSVTQDGDLIASMDAGLLVCGEDGSFKGYAAAEDNSWLNGVFCDGADIYCAMYDGMNGGYGIYKFVGGKLTSVGSDAFKQEIRNVYNFIGVYDGVLYYSGNYGVSAYDMANDKSNEVLNYLNSDINPNETPRLTLLDSETFLGVFTEYDKDYNSTTTIRTLVKIPDSELQEEIIVRIASVYSQYYLTKSVVDYNKQNNGIRITMSDYSQYNNEENGWTGASTQFNNDIITGNLPDIIVLSSDLPVESYTHKGIFEDLTPYIEGENGLDTSDFMMNILDATKVNGKQYSVIAAYSLSTLIAKNKYVGTAEGMTFEDMMKVISSLPEGTEAFFGSSRDNIIDNLFGYALSSFVDWDSGTTKFDSQGFIDLIKYISTCPEKGYWDDYYGDDYEYDEARDNELNSVYEMRFYNDKGIFDTRYISSFTDLMYARNSFGTDDINTIGYPTSDGSNGTVIVPDTEFAVSAKSQAKDQAWDIIKYFLSGNFTTYNFGLMRSDLNEKLKEAGENWYSYGYSDDDREYFLSCGYSEEYIDYLFNSRADFDEAYAEKTMNLIESAKIVQRTDDALVDIIKEELSGFFGGTKTAEETAKVIASRAGIYISENS